MIHPDCFYQLIATAIIDYETIRLDLVNSLGDTYMRRQQKAIISADDCLSPVPCQPII